jgi:hypothetical protein
MTSMTPMTRTVMIRVTELWASRQHCDAALNLPGVEKIAAQVMGLLVAGEIYVAVSGSDAVRVAPASAGELEAGPDGLGVLAFGSHSPGDGELIADWWTT